MSLKLDIIYEDPSKTVFLPGDVVVGTLRVTNKSKPVKIDGLHIQLIGHGSVYWKEKTNLVVVKVIEFYENRADYYGFHMNLITESRRLVHGFHDFPFDFQIPTGNIPSSFKCKTGGVYHKLVVGVNWMGGNLDEKIFPLNVEGILDLRSVNGPSTLLDLQCAKAKCGRFQVTFPSSGIVAGKDVDMQLNVENYGERPLKGVTIKLIRSVTCYANGESKRQGQKKYTVFQGLSKVDAKQSQTTVEVVKIPNVVVTDLACCDFISVSYKLKAKIRGSSLHDEAPVIIGSII